MPRCIHFQANQRELLTAYIVLASGNMRKINLALFASILTMGFIDLPAKRIPSFAVSNSGQIPAGRRGHFDVKIKLE